MNKFIALAILLLTFSLYAKESHKIQCENNDYQLTITSQCDLPHMISIFDVHDASYAAKNDRKLGSKLIIKKKDRVILSESVNCLGVTNDDFSEPILSTYFTKKNKIELEIFLYDDWGITGETEAIVLNSSLGKDLEMMKFSKCMAN